MVDGRDGLVEDDLARVEVDVAPPEPEGLTTPAASGGEKQPRGLVAVVAQEVEELGEGGGAPSLISGDLAWAAPGGWAAWATLRGMRSQATASRSARPMIVWM